MALGDVQNSIYINKNDDIREDTRSTTELEDMSPRIHILTT